MARSGSAERVARSPTSIDETLTLLKGAGYVADRALATVLFLALKLGRPLFLEGEAGVGKTEIAKVLSAALGRRLIRLQCYEGLDVAPPSTSGTMPGQMMAIRLAEAGGSVDRETLESDLFSERYLVKRPLLQALEPDPAGAPVLLIDELDRTDEAFEAFLLEVLSDFQVTVPEFGTVKAEHPPIVIITSNRTREIHDALKRRCLYHWVDYPDAARELAILRSRLPDAPRSSPARSSPSSRRSARKSCSRCPASPRPWTGPPPSSNSMRSRSIPRSSPTRSASSSNIRTTSRRCRAAASRKCSIRCAAR